MTSLKDPSFRFDQATQSFLGYLEGTERAELTIKNYASDLRIFQRFLTEKLNLTAPVCMGELTPAHIQAFESHLRSQGLQSNTRRRIILTLNRFFGFLAHRKKIAVENAARRPVPLKIERIPLTLSLPDILARIEELPSQTILARRNQTILRVLAETGCLVSELPPLQSSDFQAGAVQIGGKAKRTLPVSKTLSASVERLQQDLRSLELEEQATLFFGFNKFGPLRSPISPRGIELLVKAHAVRLGNPDFTPRIFRHSAVLHWFKEGLGEIQIQERLGLKTTYAFRTFEPLLAQWRQAQNATSPKGEGPSHPTG